MDAAANKFTSSTTIPYTRPDSDVVFRLAWYVVGSQPGMLLTDYSEAESKEFEGTVQLSGKIDETPTSARISVIGTEKQIQLSVSCDDEAILNEYVQSISQFIKTSLEKYLTMEDGETSRLRRALVAKTCWDRVVFLILKKAEVSSIYYQVAHGREMMIKATEGDDIHPVTLSTSGWLSKIEQLPNDSPMPADIATELAKKSIEWKRETQAFIEQYLALRV